MIRTLPALVSLLSFCVRSHASLEPELIALRHQVVVLRQQRAPPPSTLNRLFVLGVALPSAASTPRYLGTRQTSDREVPVARCRTKAFTQTDVITPDRRAALWHPEDQVYRNPQ